MSFLCSINSTFALSRDRKGISKTTFILVSANKKVFSKNQTQSKLIWGENLTETILLVSSTMPSMFWAPTLVFLLVRPSFAT